MSLWDLLRLVMILSNQSNSLRFDSSSSFFSLTACSASHISPAMFQYSISAFLSTSAYSDFFSVLALIDSAKLSFFSTNPLTSLLLIAIWRSSILFWASSHAYKYSLQSSIYPSICSRPFFSFLSSASYFVKLIVTFSVSLVLLWMSS